MTGGYCYLWEFIVQPARQAEFLRHYGPDGSWAALGEHDEAAGPG